jgi:multiple sugar transport system permease protein
MKKRHSTGAACWFVGPWIVGFLCLYVYPFAMSLWWSFCEYDLLSSPRFVGTVHYRRLASEFIAADGFGRACWNTFYYAVLAVPLSIVAGISLALMLSWPIRGRGILRTMCYVPTVVPTVAVAILWMWMLDPAEGIVNRVLSILGIPPQGWFADFREAAWVPDWLSGHGGFGSKDALVMMAVWGGGNLMVIYMAALTQIPSALYEAAVLDGAGRIRRFLFVTLPHLTPVILFNLITGLVQSVQAFTQMYIVSEGTGAPRQSTLVLSMHIFLSAFQDLDMGYASAMAWILFVLLMLATWLLMRWSQSWVFYPRNP